MSDIFLSYARADRDHAVRLARVLEASGWSVWWDPRILPGQTFDRTIEEAIAAARCVVVLWSRTSVASDWVRVEATEGRRRGILLPVLIEDAVTIPMAFRLIEAANLVGWREEADHPEFAVLKEAIGAILGQPAPRGGREQQPLAEARPGPAGRVDRPSVERIGVVRDEWIEIQGNDEFLMGTTEDEIKLLASKHDWARQRREAGWWEDEQPRKVGVHSFRMGKYPVTNAQYRRFVEAQSQGKRPVAPGYWDDPRFNPPDHPVVGVSWHEALAYCSWLTEYLRERGEIARDQAIRLPLEREWEYAARGPERRIWPWGDEWDASRANTAEGGKSATNPVTAYPDGVSRRGVFDMAGSVWEWCEDKYGEHRRLRGGSWDSDAVYARAAYRGHDTPDFRNDDIGFRCVVVPHSSPRE